MNHGFAILAASLFAGASVLSAQTGGLQVPKSVEAGAQFSIQTSGSGKGTLYIVGPSQLLKRDIDLGQPAVFEAGTVYNAGHYLVILKSGDSAETGEIDVTAAARPSKVSFLARPSRLPVNIHGAITGAAYVFDAYDNLITIPTSIDFELLNPSGAKQAREVMTHEGSAFVAMDSTPQQGADKFTVRAGDVTSTRVVGQVPGDPCGIRMTAKPSGQEIQLQTEPLRDCSGNAVPDGTVVTFTETFAGSQSTVDVPVKRGIAQVNMPAHNGAMLTAASGVVLGNQIRWEK